MNEAQKQQLMYRIDEILYYLWDPIGVNDAPGARDEYSSYAGHVWKMAMGGEAKESISNYLTDITVSRMGLKARKEHDNDIAKLIIRWKEYFDNFG
ncbi:MAG TPA: hypothetical protein VLF69_04570 [Candidatus Saccharimonadales bacterium]|nr:hypothetical protein [Candidatus Saccharimonadales bacterium]